MSLPNLFRRTSSIELLEARIVPASVSASLAGTTLKILPAPAIGPVDFVLQQTGPESFLLTDSGEAPVEFTGVKRLQIDLSNAADDIDLLFAGSFRGSVKINGGTGTDSISIAGDGVIASDVSITSAGASNVSIGADLAILGALKTTGIVGQFILAGSVGGLMAANSGGTISLAPGSTVFGNVKISATQSLDLDALGSIFGSLAVKGVDQNESILLNGAVNDRVNLNLGDGGAIVTVDPNFRGRGNFTLITGNGFDSVTFRPTGATSETVLSGILKLHLGDGANSLSVGAKGVIGGLRVAGGIDSDVVTIVQGTLTVAGRTVFGLGAGENSIAVNDSNQFFGGFQYTGKEGGDDVIISGASIQGSAKFTLGDGGTFFELNDSNVFGPLTITGGAGADALGLQGTEVHGKLTTSLRDGANSLFTLDLIAYHRVAYSGGADADELIFDFAKLHGTLQINAGDGPNELDLTSLSNLTTVKYTGGEGVDTVLITGFAPSTGAGFTRGQVKLGGGDDFIRLTNPSFLSFTLDGGAGANDRYQYSLAAAALDVISKNFEITEEFPFIIV